MEERQKPNRDENVVAGRNAVAELLRSGREIDSLYIQKGELKGSAVSLVAKARQLGIPVKEADSRKLDFMCGGVNHQGIVAVAAARSYTELADILAQAGEAPFLVVCDHLEDPHNLGAVIRTAEAAGAHGVIIPKRGGVGLTTAVAKASAGAVEHLPVARVSNIASTIKELQKRGIWVYCADMDGQPWCATDFSGGVALVVGSEGQGVSRLVREACDAAVALPMLGQVNSLNASVAAGIVLYEICRQRQGIAAKNAAKK